MPSIPAPLIVGAIAASCAALAVALFGRQVNRERYESLPAWAVVGGVAAFVAMLGVSAYAARSPW